jgi:hypothetical protein
MSPMPLVGTEPDEEIAAGNPLVPSCQRKTGTSIPMAARLPRPTPAVRSTPSTCDSGCSTTLLELGSRRTTGACA